ncbi:MAG: TrkH family potassium uptake protein [Planctomycetota bacterium]
MNTLRVVQVVGLLLAVLSLTMLVPLVMAIAFGETLAAEAFGVAIGTGLALGGGAALAGRRAEGRFYRREALGVVALAWIVAAAVGCIPYLVTQVIASPIGAYFETMSGFTTTGASVLESVEFAPDGSPIPRSIIFWRGMTNWLGGVGIVVLFVAILPALGVSSREIFHMEVPGVGEKGFMPHIRQTAMALWILYVGLTVLCTAALLLLGLDWFDAICHAFATLATGGFSSHSDSVGHYADWRIHAVITLFMFLAGVNFTLFFRLALKRDVRGVLRNPELRFYVGVTLLAIILVGLDLLFRGHVGGVGEALDQASFQVVTISTTTGFATEDFDAWPSFSRLVLVLLMFVGACAGSTAGGLKVFRVMLVLKYGVRQLRLHIRPRSVEKLKFGHDAITVDVIRPVVGMVVTFVLVFVLGSLLLAALGLDMTTSVTASIAALGNIGPGLGSVGPACNYAHIPPAGQAVLSFLMLVGRLEIFTALSLFAPALWRD